MDAGEGCFERIRTHRTQTGTHITQNLTHRTQNRTYGTQNQTYRTQNRTHRTQNRTHGILAAVCPNIDGTLRPKIGHISLKRYRHNL